MKSQNAKLNPSSLNPDRGTKSFGKFFISYREKADTEVSNRMNECILDIVSLPTDWELFEIRIGL